VALSGITAGVGGGAAKQRFGAAFVHGAEMAAASNLAGYALHRVVGEDASFSLRGLVSDTLAGGLAEGVLGPAMTLNGTAVGGNIASSASFSWTAVAAAAAKSVLRQGISYGVHQAIEGHATWNNGQVLGTAITDAAVAAAGMTRADEQRAKEAQQFYETAMADGNPFNGSIAGDDSIPDLSTDAGLSAVVEQIWAANTDQPLLASGYGHDVDPLHPQNVMSTDSPRLVIGEGKADAVTAEDLERYEIQMRIDDMKKQGIDVSDFQARLDAISRSSQIAKLDSLFPGDPLDPNISDAELVELSKTYALALNRTQISDAVTLDTVVVSPQTIGTDAATNSSQINLFDIGVENSSRIAFGIGALDVMWNIRELAAEKLPTYGVYAKPNYGLSMSLNDVPGVNSSRVVPSSAWQLGVEAVRDGVVRRPYLTTFNIGDIPVNPVVYGIAEKLPYIGLGWEAATMDWSDAGDRGHLGVSTGVTVFAAALAAAPETLGASFFVGAGYFLLDTAAQHYEYNGQSGWRAVGGRISDSEFLRSYNQQMEQVYKIDPNFYRGPKF
jgi:hypothetical protein